MTTAVTRPNAYIPGNAGSDRPEQVQQIQRVFDGGTEADDRQRTDHTKGDDNVGTDGQRYHAGQHTHANQRDSKAAGIYNAGIKLPIDKIDEDPQCQCSQQGKRQFGSIVLGKGVQDGFFDKVFCAHGRKVPFYRAQVSCQYANPFI